MSKISIDLNDNNINENNLKNLDKTNNENIKNLLKEFQNMEMNGKMFKMLLKLAQALKPEVMRKNFF